MIYETDYLPLAAFLHSQNIELIEVRPKDLTGKWIIFTFNNPSDELLNSYQNHTAIGNIHRYYDSLKYLRNRIAEVRGEFNRQ